MADQSYVVTAACAMVQAGDRYVTVAKGGAVPADADPEHVALLLDRGMVEEGEPVAGFVLEPGFGTDPVAPAAPVEVDDVDGDGPIPAKSANKDAWVAYAVSQGADQAEAEAATKVDLIATYGSA